MRDLSQISFSSPLPRKMKQEFPFDRVFFFKKKSQKNRIFKEKRIRRKTRKFPHAEEDFIFSLNFLSYFSFYISFLYIRKKKNTENLTPFLL